VLFAFRRAASLEFCFLPLAGILEVDMRESSLDLGDARAAGRPGVSSSVAYSVAAWQPYYGRWLNRMAV
jgi:hypothetical protein